jgi:hypothetical protein
MRRSTLLGGRAESPQSHLFCHSEAAIGLASVEIGNFWSIFNAAKVTHLRGGNARLTPVFVVDATTNCWRLQRRVLRRILLCNAV